MDELNENECKTLISALDIVYGDFMKIKRDIAGDTKRHLGDELYASTLELYKNNFEDLRELTKKCNCEIPKRIENRKI